MLDIKKEKIGDGEIALHLKGDVTIETVAILRDALTSGLGEADHLMIDGGELENIDFFGLQLLCSAHRTSIAWMKLLTWRNAIAPEIEKLVEKTGFSRNHGCSLCPDNMDCMWLCGTQADS